MPGVAAGTEAVTTGAVGPPVGAADAVAPSDCAVGAAVSDRPPGADAVTPGDGDAVTAGNGVAAGVAVAAGAGNTDDPQPSIKAAAATKAGRRAAAGRWRVDERECGFMAERPW